LTPESIEVLDGALNPKRVEITRQSLQAELEAVLRRGFTTTHAGGFFFIPYLMELGVYKDFGQLSTPKTTGIPTEKVALQLVWEPLFGYVKGIRAVDSVSQVDFGVLSGLPFICSVSTEYRFLAESTTQSAAKPFRSNWENVWYICTMFTAMCSTWTATPSKCSPAKR
jgi:hypothetical protein